MKDSFASRQRKRRTTPEQRAKWVRRYERSGMSQRAFAERHNLGLFTLRKWIAQNALQPPGGSEARAVWQELKLDGLPSATRWAAEVVRADGLVVRVAPDAPAALLAELLTARSC
jgi:transposase-like protein